MKLTFYVCRDEIIISNVKPTLIGSLALELTYGFYLTVISLCRSFSPRSFTAVSVNKPLSVIAAWQALCIYVYSSSDIIQ